MDPKRVATEFVTQKMLIKQERIWASKYMTAVWGNNLTGVSGTPSTNEFKQWDASSGVTILKNVGTWREQIASVTGNEPNKMVIAPDVFEVLTQAQEIKDTIQYSSGGVVTEDLLARLFRVEEVIVPRGIVNTANAGATAALQRIVAKKVLFCYAPKKVTTMTPTAGITFNWTGRKGSSKFGTRIKDYYIEPLDSHRVEGEVRVDFKQVASACGVYAAAVIA